MPQIPHKQINLQNPNIKITTLFYQDRIIARLQQPYSLDCIPVEAEYQVRFLIISASDFL